MVQTITYGKTHNYNHVLDGQRKLINHFRTFAHSRAPMLELESRTQPYHRNELCVCERERERKEIIVILT